MSSSSSFDVRPAKMSEAQAIADLHVSASQAAYHDLIPAEHLNTMPMA